MQAAVLKTENWACSGDGSLRNELVKLTLEVQGLAVNPQAWAEEGVSMIMRTHIPWKRQREPHRPEGATPSPGFSLVLGVLMELEGQGSFLPTLGAMASMGH